MRSVMTRIEPTVDLTGRVVWLYVRGYGGTYVQNLRGLTAEMYLFGRSPPGAARYVELNQIPVLRSWLMLNT